MNTDTDLLHNQELYVRSYEVDPDHRVRVGQLINYMQDAAWNHTIKMQVSIHDLQRKGLSWVLARKKVEIKRMPEHRDQLIVQTWPSGFEKFFFYRDFRIKDQDGNELIRATSTWLIFDINTRKMVPVPDFLQSIPANQEQEHMPYAKDKISPVSNADHSCELQVCYRDMDINQHTNNSHYFQWIADSVTEIDDSMSYPESVDLQFRSESKAGDQMTILTEKVGNKEYIHQIINKNSGENVVQARTTWKLP